MDLPVFEKLIKVELKEEWENITDKALSELTDRPTGDDLSEAVLHVAT